MKIGDPIKDKIKVEELRGRYVVTNDTMEIVAPTRRSALRFGVVLRRRMAVEARPPRRANVAIKCGCVPAA